MKQPIEGCEELEKDKLYMLNGLNKTRDEMESRVICVIVNLGSASRKTKFAYILDSLTQCDQSFQNDQLRVKSRCVRVQLHL